MIKLCSHYKTSEAQLSQSLSAYQRLVNRKDLGFHQLPQRKILWESVLKRGEEIAPLADQMVVCGIGGSSLGGLAIADTLQIKNVYFFENVDALDFWSKLGDVLNLERTHWVFVSKSGSTVETLTQLNFISEFYEDHHLQLSTYSTVITEDKESPLSHWAKDHRVTQLEVPLDVGGRFSVLSPVGLLAAHFGGASVLQMMEGAGVALEQKQLVAETALQFLESFKNEKWISIFWFYSSRMRYFGLWLEQLWAESLAKKKDRQGKTPQRVSTPISLVGANDQHSVLQQLAEGASDKFVSFFRFNDVENFGKPLSRPLFQATKGLRGKSMGALLGAEAQATGMALEESGVPCQHFNLQSLDSRTLGYLFMFWELVVGTLGEAIDIDTFNQPGVERGKVLARQILENS